MTITSFESELEDMLTNIFGDHVWDDSALKTAVRVLSFWKEFTNIAGPPDLTTFNAYAQQLIVVKDVEFSSICAHHLLPFYGRAHLGYLPHSLMVGVSKIPRLIRYYAQRPQTQERLTKQVATHFKKELDPKAVGVVMEAVHTCMACRGIRAYSASMVTSEMRGIFLTSDRPRQEFLEMIR